MASRATSMPAVFVGHGNPMNVVRRNQWTKGWAALGAALPRPRGILAVSAHWYVPGHEGHGHDAPPYIHDFRGFPQELYEVGYPAPGDPALAARVRDLLAPLPVDLDEEWGLDHGAWSVLVHLFPDAAFRSCSSASTARNLPRSTTKSEDCWRRCGTRGCSCWGAGTSCTTCRPTSGNGPLPAPSTGPRDSKTRSRRRLVDGSDAELTDYARLRPERTSPSRRRITIFRCSTCSGRAEGVSASAFRSKDSTGGRSPCLPSGCPGGGT